MSANVAPAVTTITGSTGAGEAVTALRFADVVSIEVNFSRNTLRVTRSGVGGNIYFDYSIIGTVTWTIASGVTTIVFS